MRSSILLEFSSQFMVSLCLCRTNCQFPWFDLVTCSGLRNWLGARASPRLLDVARAEVSTSSGAHQNPLGLFHSNSWCHRTGGKSWTNAKLEDLMGMNKMVSSQLDMGALYLTGRPLWKPCRKIQREVTSGRGMGVEQSQWLYYWRQRQRRNERSKHQW